MDKHETSVVSILSTVRWLTAVIKSLLRALLSRTVGDRCVTAVWNVTTEDHHHGSTLSTTASRHHQQTTTTAGVRHRPVTSSRIDDNGQSSCGAMPLDENGNPLEPLHNRHCDSIQQQQQQQHRLRCVSSPSKPTGGTVSKHRASDSSLSSGLVVCESDDVTPSISIIDCQSPPLDGSAADDVTSAAAAPSDGSASLRSVVSGDYRMTSSPSAAAAAVLVNSGVSHGGRRKRSNRKKARTSHHRVTTVQSQYSELHQPTPCCTAGVVIDDLVVPDSGVRVTTLNDNETIVDCRLTTAGRQRCCQVNTGSADVVDDVVAVCPTSTTIPPPAAAMVDVQTGDVVVSIPTCRQLTSLTGDGGSSTSGDCSCLVDESSSSSLLIRTTSPTTNCSSEYYTRRDCSRQSTTTTTTDDSVEMCLDSCGTQLTSSVSGGGCRCSSCVSRCPSNSDDCRLSSVIDRHHSCDQRRQRARRHHRFDVDAARSFLFHEYQDVLKMSARRNGQCSVVFYSDDEISTES